MGQTHSIEEESGEIHNITNNYTQIKKFTDTRFGEVKLLQEKNHWHKSPPKRLHIPFSQRLPGIR